MQSVLRFALLTLAVIAPAAAADPMLDPVTDDPRREWCYLAKSTTVIGVPYQPDVTQVTYDGALFTRSAELCFFYGEPLRPMLARQKTFLEGWMPIVLYDWSDGPIHYDIEMFAAPLELEEECCDVSNTVNFVRLRMRNAGDRPAKGVFAAAMRQSGEDYRLGQAPALDPTCRYEMTDDAACYEKADDAAFRGGALIYTFSSYDAIRQAVPGAAYREPFTAAEHNVTPRTEVCLARYERELAPGQSVSVVFKMPRVPMPQTDWRNFPPLLPRRSRRSVPPITIATALDGGLLEDLSRKRHGAGDSRAARAGRSTGESCPLGVGHSPSQWRPVPDRRATLP